jgi:hypothetical protein
VDNRGSGSPPLDEREARRAAGLRLELRDVVRRRVAIG